MDELLLKALCATFLAMPHFIRITLASINQSGQWWVVDLVMFQVVWTTHF